MVQADRGELALFLSAGPASGRLQLSHCLLKALRKPIFIYDDRLLSALLETDMIANEAFDTRLEQLEQMEERRRARARGDRPRRNPLRA